VILGESLIHGNNVINNSITIDISNLSRSNGSAVSINADFVSSNEVREISNEDEGVSNLDLLENLGGDDNWLEGEAVGFVVLSGLSDVSNNDKSISDSSGGEERVVRGKNVPRNSSLTGDGSSRSNNVVDHSLNNSWEWLSLNGDWSSSSDIDDPRRGKSAVDERIPIGSAQISSIDLDVVQRRTSGASDEQTISVLQLVVGILSESSEISLNGGEISLGSIESSRGVGIRVSINISSRSYRQIVGCVEVSSNKGNRNRSSSNEITSVGIQRSRLPRDISSSQESGQFPSIGGDFELLSKSETSQGSLVAESKSSFNVSSITSVRIERNDVKVRPRNEFEGNGWDSWRTKAFSTGSRAGSLELNVAHSKEFSASDSVGCKGISRTSGICSGTLLGNVTRSSNSSTDGGRVLEFAVRTAAESSVTFLSLLNGSVTASVDSRSGGKFATLAAKSNKSISRNKLPVSQSVVSVEVDVETSIGSNSSNISSASSCRESLRLERGHVNSPKSPIVDCGVSSVSAAVEGDSIDSPWN